VSSWPWGAQAYPPSPPPLLRLSSRHLLLGHTQRARSRYLALLDLLVADANQGLPAAVAANLDADFMIEIM
jgi:hypothetical protein